MREGLVGAPRVGRGLLGDAEDLAARGHHPVVGGGQESRAPRRHRADHGAEAVVMTPASSGAARVHQFEDLAHVLDRRVQHGDGPELLARLAELDARVEPLGHHRVGQSVGLVGEGQHVEAASGLALGRQVRVRRLRGEVTQLVIVTGDPAVGREDRVARRRVVDHRVGEGEHLDARNGSQLVTDTS